MKNLHLLALTITLLTLAPQLEAAKAKSSMKKSESKKGYTEIKSEDEFDKALGKSGTYVVKFHSPSCSYCTKMAPDFEKVSQEMQGQATFLSVNTAEPELQDLARTFNVSGLPTTLFITKKSGALSQEALRQEVLNSLGRGHLPRASESAAPAPAAAKSTKDMAKPAMKGKMRPASAPAAAPAA